MVLQCQFSVLESTKSPKEDQLVAGLFDRSKNACPIKNGAGKETLTPDLFLGKEAL